MAESPRLRPLLLVLAGATLWGTAGPASQILYNTTDTSPLAVALLRMALAAPLLVLLAARTGRRLGRGHAPRGGVLLLGGTCIALYQVLYFQAVAVSGVTLATLTALCPVPVLVAILARGLLGERSTPVPWGGILLATAGTLLLVGTPETAAPLAQRTLGAGLGVLASLAFSGIALTGRALGTETPPLAVTARLFVVGALVLAPVLLLEAEAVGAALQAPAPLAFLVVVPTVLAYGLFYSGVGAAPAALTGVLIVAEPLTAAALGWALLGENLGGLQSVGGLLLCAAMVRAARDPRRS